MKADKTTYPQYRKYHNDKSYFKIISPTKFDEIQITKTKATFHSFEAKILPDRNYIYDMTFNYKKYWLVCDSKEYNNLLSLIN